ncbi:NUMOD4 motif-containing HNH endonuclease [Microbacterium sp. KNMS]
MNQELWRAIPGYEGLYEVSSAGEVRSLDRVRASDGALIRGRVLSQGQYGGYRQVNLSRGGVVTKHRIHSLVLSTFVGPRPHGAEGCHNDGDPSNNRLENLRWGSRSANAIDSVRHGTHGRIQRTHCPRGHRLEVPNLVSTFLKQGRRNCRSCAAERNRARRAGEPFSQDRADAFFKQLVA